MIWARGVETSIPWILRRGHHHLAGRQVLEVQDLADHLGGLARHRAGALALADRVLDLGLGHAGADRAPLGHAAADGPADQRQGIGQRDEQPLEGLQEDEGQGGDLLGAAAGQGPQDLDEDAVGDHDAEDGHRQRPAREPEPGRDLVNQHRGAAQGDHPADQPPGQDADGVRVEPPERRPVPPRVGGERGHAAVGDLAQRGVPGSEERPDHGPQPRKNNLDDESPWPCRHLALTFSHRGSRQERRGPKVNLAERGPRSSGCERVGQHATAAASVPMGGHEDGAVAPRR